MTFEAFEYTSHLYDLPDRLFTWNLRIKPPPLHRQASVSISHSHFYVIHQSNNHITLAPTFTLALASALTLTAHVHSSAFLTQVYPIISPICHRATSHALQFQGSLNLRQCVKDKRCILPDQKQRSILLFQSQLQQLVGFQDVYLGGNTQSHIRRNHTDPYHSRGPAILGPRSNSACLKGCLLMRHAPMGSKRKHHRRRVRHASLYQPGLWLDFPACSRNRSTHQTARHRQVRYKRPNVVRD